MIYKLKLPTVLLVYFLEYKKEKEKNTKVTQHERVKFVWKIETLS
jgi:hypothetical protein